MIIMFQSLLYSIWPRYSLKRNRCAAHTIISGFYCSYFTRFVYQYLYRRAKKSLGKWLKKKSAFFDRIDLIIKNSFNWIGLNRLQYKSTTFTFLTKTLITKPQYHIPQLQVGAFGLKRNVWNEKNVAIFLCVVSLKQFIPSCSIAIVVAMSTNYKMKHCAKSIDTGGKKRAAIGTATKWI